jgi:hypothetical protein
MALEAFLMHYRNLRAFLCPNLQRVAEDDIIASDFLKEPAARDIVDASKFKLDKERLDGCFPISPIGALVTSLPGIISGACLTWSERCSWNYKLSSGRYHQQWLRGFRL